MLLFVSKEYSSTNIVNGVKEFLKNIQNHIDKKFLYMNHQYDFLFELIRNKEQYKILKSLENNETLEKIVNENELYKYLQYLKKLSSKDIISFTINLNKNGHEINYFRLSSGEKTLLSYFANIIGRINELYRIDFLHNQSNNSESSIPIYQGTYQIKP